MASMCTGPRPGTRHWRVRCGPYSVDPLANPWHRFGINNADGEDLAVWRALAWALTGGRERYALPVFDRDGVAAKLHVPRHDLVLVRWEYRVDVEQETPDEADLGFLPAKACVRIHPQPDAWELEHRDEAGLFQLSSFSDLTGVDLVLSRDVWSELGIFGLQIGIGGAERLIESLRAPEQPQLAQVLGPGDVFVDLAIVRDRFLGNTSYFTLVSPAEMGARLAVLVDHYEAAFVRYADRAPGLKNFEAFAAAVEELLRGPPAIGGSV
jgi:hypothetical protein